MTSRSLCLLAFVTVLAGPAAYAGDGAAPVDINTADRATLDSMPGMGSQEAAAIVAYREAHGPFQSVEQVKQVPGVSPRSIDNLRAELVVGDSEFAKMEAGKAPAKTKAAAPATTK